MPIRYLTPRPQVVEALEWTGDNFAEVVTFGSSWGFTAVDNGDGTITTTGVCCAGNNLPVGTWLVANRAQTPTSAEVEDQYQDLPSTGAPYEYGVTTTSTP
ncbi:hypothetical protein AB0J55_17665 [Amycolatopsis sp. NPDC049688]|uniref:hypothetical protein n=1 Tax=Amycolatopsis sp. NPDC049688 TaxID=3154733 RepID=UPI0034387990